MGGRFKLIISLTIFMTLSSMLFYLKSNSDDLQLTASNALSTSLSFHGIFSCYTWKNLTYIDVPKYEKCLKQSRNDEFWPVQGLRHTAFKNLLNSSSLIVEVGGNTGLDTVEFIKLYNASIISFEPIVEMSVALMEKFKTYPNIEIQPFGLGSQERNLSIELFDTDNAGTSIFRKISSKNSSKIKHIQLLNVIQVIENIRKTRTKNGIIDMISINCEGCEFEILPALIHNNMIQYFRIIQFASHMNFFTDSSCIYCQIQQALELSHKILYQYVMLWEAWILNK